MILEAEWREFVEGQCFGERVFQAVKEECLKAVLGGDHVYVVLTTGDTRPLLVARLATAVEVNLYFG